MTSYYLICTTPRSGSNLLCSYAESCKMLGRPDEFFNSRVIKKGSYGQKFEFAKDVSLQAYIDWISANFASARGVLGVKLLYDDFRHLIGLESMRRLVEASKLVYLERTDKIQQSVSYYLAETTGQWMHDDVAARQRNEVAYDFRRLNEIHKMLVQQDLDWQMYFNARNNDVLRLIYEDYIGDPIAAVQAIGNFMGLKIPAEAISTDMISQKTDMNNEFAARYKADFLQDLQASRDFVEYEGLGFVK